MGSGRRTGKLTEGVEEEPLDLFTWLHRFDLGEAMFHVANGLGQSPSVAWETTLADYMLLQKHWARHPPLHLVAGAFIKRDESSSKAPKRQPARQQPVKVDEAQDFQLAQEQGLGAQRSSKSVPGHDAFAEKLKEVGNDPAKMAAALQESFEQAKRNEILKMREDMKREREARLSIAAGRPAW